MDTDPCTKTVEPTTSLSVSEIAEFREKGYLNLGRILSDSEVQKFEKMFDDDRTSFRYLWHAYGYHQEANYEALISSPEFDNLIRHPRIYPKICSLFGGPVCFGEIGLRRMSSYDGDCHQEWHRDRGYWMDHPLRLDYMQLLVYLTDVNASTHCFSISPESVEDEPLKKVSEQLRRSAGTHLYGPAGTCVLFNVALFHTATTRPTTKERKTVQIYYGHVDRAPLANDSGIPLSLSASPYDADTREFYGNLNERSKLFMAAYRQP